jgi:choline dehydrogenase-like flavoprotein
MNATPFDADIVVVGSGPAGVSVTFPLVTAGMRVLMLDGSGPDAASAPQHEQRWRSMLGPDLEALRPEDGISPKLRTPEARRIIGAFHRAVGIRGDGFRPVAALARGGLSRIWGACVSEFDADDLRDWPISVDDLRPSYRAVTARIGVSGASDDDMSSFYGLSGPLLPPLPLGPSPSEMVRRYRRHRRSLPPEFAMGAARNAILSIAQDGREPCDLRKGCLWGCKRGAIYDSRFDLARLAAHAGFRLADGVRVTAVRPVPGGWKLSAQDGRKFRAPRVVLAAGTLATSALVASLLPGAPRVLRLLSNPVLAIPLLVPARLGRAAATDGHALAQLGYFLRFGSAAHDRIVGQIYEIDALPAASFVARLPFSRPAGDALFSAFVPAMVIATAYFPGHYSDNQIRFEPDGDGASIVVSGGFDAALAPQVRQVARRLRSIFRKLGAWTLPGTTLAPPGADVHYAGPLGMGNDGAHGTSAFGELRAAPGLYVVDGAALPTLPSKHVTLTIMANADRIGRHLAAREGRQ